MIRRRSITAALLAAVALTVFLATGGSGVSATTCPPSDPGQLTSQRPAAATSLVPDGASALIVCEFNFIGYPGAGAHNALIGTGTSTDTATVTGIEDQLDALSEGPNYPIACPADAGQAYVAYFEYPSGVDDPVRLQLGGCDQVSNGPVTRLAIGAPVVEQITGLVKPTSTTPTTPLPLGPGPVVFSWIAGALQVCGGPAPGGCHVESFSSCGPGGCVHADRARILQGGKTIDTVRLKQGRFKVTVSPGRYAVQLLGDGRHVHGKVLQRKTVVAKKYATAHVTFTIAVP
jgi:hypothetical protein